MTRSDDRDAIRALIHEYCFRLDDGDLDGVATLFADAEFSSSTNMTPRRGTAAVREMLAGVILYDDGTPRSQHMITNTTITFDADNAAASRSYFCVLQSRPGFPLQPILAGAYVDQFARVDGAWRFAARFVDPRHTGDLTEHMRGRRTASG
jgi:hypothetical protein